MHYFMSLTTMKPYPLTEWKLENLRFSPVEMHGSWYEEQNAEHYKLGAIN